VTRLNDPQTALLQAALPHVAFDGWSDACFHAAVADSGVDPTVARALFPRRATDLALAFHRQGDAAMEAAIRSSDLNGLRFSDKIALAVRLRLEGIDDKEAVRRGVTLMALPMNAPDGAKAIWGTADRIWTILGDTSTDHNWYSKRATLSGVYSATVLYWLGDDSSEHQATWEFLDRRIDNVMQIEKLKGQMRKVPGLGPFVQGAEKLLSRVRPPQMPNDLPGRFNAFMYKDTP
jgi:ubiquinone biosynthesis protein COQ9